MAYAKSKTNKKIQVQHCCFPCGGRGEIDKCESSCFEDLDFSNEKPGSLSGLNDIGSAKN